VSVVGDVGAVTRRIAAIAGEPLESGAADRTLARGAAPPHGRDAFMRIIERSAAAARVAPSLVAAVAQIESGFDPNATSRTGAAGIMQLMPQTARSLGVTDPYDPAANIRGGATYLRELLDRFSGDVRLAVAAYNAGPGAVERYGGVPPYRETQGYVTRVLDAFRAGLAR
jgi:soluble lytic murein transglycosylase-like protein